MHYLISFFARVVMENAAGPANRSEATAVGAGSAAADVAVPRMPFGLVLSEEEWHPPSPPVNPDKYVKKAWNIALVVFCQCRRLGGSPETYKWPDRGSESLRDHCRMESAYADTFTGLPSRKGRAATSKANQMFDNLKMWIQAMELRKTKLQGAIDKKEILVQEHSRVPNEETARAESLHGDILHMNNNIDIIRRKNDAWR